MSEREARPGRRGESRARSERKPEGRAARRSRAKRAPARRASEGGRLQDLPSEGGAPLGYLRRVKVRVLGSCAGGGLPQWNCGGPNSMRARAGDPAVPPRLQPSVAVSADGRRWSLLNASPDLREQLARFPGLHTDLTQLLQLPGVLQAPATDAAALQEQALSLLDDVLDEFVASREREGGKLAAVINERVDGIARIAGEVRALMPAIRAGQRLKLETRLSELSQPLDSGRLEQELVLWLQKLDVEEELDRLDSHVTEARRVLKLREAVGRRLDFLLQEFNREANTLGSKSVDARSSAAAVDLKVLIDQVREQIQNIE